MSKTSRRSILFLVGAASLIAGCPGAFGPEAITGPLVGRGQIADLVPPEDPLPTGEGVLALQPEPPVLASEQAAVRFSNGSPYFVWVDDAGDHLMVGQVGGSIRRLGPFHRSSAFDPDWSADGQRVLVLEYLQRPTGGDTREIPLRAVVWELGGATSSVVSEDVPPNTRILPDGSGITWHDPLDTTGAPAGPPVMPAPLNPGDEVPLYVLRPGQPRREAGRVPIGGPRAWAPDGGRLAYLKPANGDFRNGSQLMIRDVESRTTTALQRLDFDPLNAANRSGNFRWTADNEIVYATLAHSGSSGTLAITSLPANGSTARSAVFQISLAEGENPADLLLAPSGRAAAFVIYRAAEAVVGNARIGYGLSKGVFVATASDGRIRQVTTGGRPIAWLPGGRLVCATGQGRYTRYYQVDTPISEAGR